MYNVSQIDLTDLRPCGNVLYFWCITTWLSMLSCLVTVMVYRRQEEVDVTVLFFVIVPLKDYVVVNLSYLTRVTCFQALSS